jgi:hypothetical protein
MSLFFFSRVTAAASDRVAPGTLALAGESAKAGEAHRSRNTESLSSQKLFESIYDFPFFAFACA